jgi:hypothetical protein
MAPMQRSRRLQFSIRINSGPPPPAVDCFAAPGRHSFEAAFSRRARRYRMSSRIVVVLLVGFALGLLAAVNLPMPEAARGRIALLSAALLPLAVVIHFANLRLRCPSCRKALTPAKGHYCPQCGAEGYEPGSRRCEVCSGRIEEESGDDARGYRVRGCTHCGVFLDTEGL